MNSNTNSNPLATCLNRRQESFDPNNTDNHIKFAVSAWQQDNIIEIPENRKINARHARILARKEIKKINSLAKKQRNHTDLLERRAAQTVDKFIENKGRNMGRELELERHKIRMGVIHQVEKLASLYDPTGNLFNVGEVVTLPDGRVKSKESLLRAQQKKSRKRVNLEARSTEKELKNDIKMARKEIHKLSKLGIPTPPELRALAEKKLDLPQTISKRELKKQELYQSKDIHKPIIPEGYSLPEGKENMLALWDITDHEILSRLKQAKSQKKIAAQRFHIETKKVKNPNTVVKERKEQGASACLSMDPVKARVEIFQLGAEPKAFCSKSENEIHLGHLPEFQGELTANQSCTQSPLYTPRQVTEVNHKGETQIEKLRYQRKRSARAKRRSDRKAQAALRKNLVRESYQVSKCMKQNRESDVKEVNSDGKPFLKDLNYEEIRAEVTSEGCIKNVNQESLDDVNGPDSLELCSSSNEKKQAKSKPKPNPEQEILDLIRELVGNIQ